jgi:predicted nucleic acid-binding protein
MRRILDTSVLIRCWQHHQQALLKRGVKLEDFTTADAEAWADKLIELHGNAEIVTPVRLEFLAGTRNPHELRLATAFLGRFHVTDKGNVTAADWQTAEQQASRISPDGKPRDLGDCLIGAIAQRLRRDVFTLDQRFRR